MGKILKLIFAPLRALSVWKLGLRKKMFDSGRWKSVEFEFPVLAVDGFNHEVDFSLILLLNESLQSQGVNSFSLLNRAQSKGLKLLKKNEEYLHLIRIEDRSFAFSFRNALLAISELAMTQEEIESVILSQRFQGVVRPAIRVLVVDFNGPFFEDDYWPNGRLMESRRQAMNADFVLVTGGDTIDSAFLDRLKDHISDQVLIGWVGRDNLSIETVFTPNRPKFETALAEAIKTKRQ